MMRHAWAGYRNYSWGANELRPKAKQPHSQSIFGGGSMGATIVDAIDTLYIMELKEEYKQVNCFYENIWVNFVRKIKV